MLLTNCCMLKPGKHNIYSHISKAVSVIIWSAAARSPLTYWANEPKPFSAQQSSVWGLKYKDKPLAFGPQDIIGGGGWFKVVCLVLVTPKLIPQTMTLLGYSLPHTGMETQMCPEPRCDSLSPIGSLWEPFSAGRADWLLTQRFAGHPAVQERESKERDSSSLTQLCCSTKMQIQVCCLKSACFDSWDARGAQAQWIIDC